MAGLGRLQFGQMVGHRGIAMTMRPTTVGRIPVGAARVTTSGLRLTNFMNRFFTLLLAASCLTAVGQSDCPNPYDGNGDGAVSISDLLDLLSLFGDVDTDSDGIWDSIDNCSALYACNYTANPNEHCTYIDVLGTGGGGC